MKFSLTRMARIRIVIGTLAITLGLMDLTQPSASAKLRWIRDWAIGFGGQYGYAVLLVVVGMAFIFWAILESSYIKGDGK